MARKNETAPARPEPSARSDGKGLRTGSLGLIGSTVIGLASTAPVYSLAATLGFVVLAVGAQAPVVFVIAFIPSESLVSSALEADPSLMDYAFQKRVALASPVTLWSVLKTVAFSWQQDVVTNEAKVLFDLSRELYGRLATMAGHVDKLGRSLRGSVNDYNRFVGSLERTVLPSARRRTRLIHPTARTSDKF